MCNFNKKDVIKVAEAVIEDSIKYMDGDYKPYFYCEYCAGEQQNKKDYKHALDCPVLSAQDLLAECNSYPDDGPNL